LRESPYGGLCYPIVYTKGTDARRGFEREMGKIVSYGLYPYGGKGNEYSLNTIIINLLNANIEDNYQSRKKHNTYTNWYLPGPL